MRNSQSQKSFFKNETRAYGGVLSQTRKGRSRGRPLSSRQSMHLVLRSSQAQGAWSFKTPAHARKIHQLINKFTKKFGVKLYTYANVGNHLHLHIQLTNIHTYKPFIRALTASIMMAVTGASRWSPVKLKGRFWDLRPFTRIVQSYQALLNLKDYIRINQFESYGFQRETARTMLRFERRKLSSA